MQQEQQDKLSVLHCRLQQEADKIRKWKNSVELELRQKDRQLQEVQELVNSKQNTLLETQVRVRAVTTVVVLLYLPTAQQGQGCVITCLPISG